MVKAVIGEETQLKPIEDRLSLSNLPSEVGLVIGRLSKGLDRGFIYNLVPTPRNDAGEDASSVIEQVPDKKKGAKGKSSQIDSSLSSSNLFIDNDWVAEHARQVSRMLVGGMKVIGIYIWLSDTCFKSSTLMLCQTVKGVAEAAPLSEIGMDDRERLLVHISYSPRRWACRTVMVDTGITSSSLRPCDFKMGRVLNSLQAFKCVYHFDLSVRIDFDDQIKLVRLEYLRRELPIGHDGISNIKTMADILRSGISDHSKELKDAKAIIDGNLVVSDEPCTSDSLHQVEFLLPFMSDTEVCNQKEADGVLVFSGSVCSFAYLNSKETVSQVLADIKSDIITSLRSRLDIICDEADGENGPTVGENERNIDTGVARPVPHLVLHSLRKQCNLAFPRRVFVPWLADTYVCDYLQPSETKEILKDHCVELMSMDPPPDLTTILEPEVETTISSTNSFWDVANNFPPVSFSDKRTSKKDKKDSGGERGTEKLLNIGTLTHLLFLLLAIAVAVIGYQGIIAFSR